MRVSKFLSGRCYPPGLIVWRPVDWNSLQLANCYVDNDGERSVIFVKPFSLEQRLQEPIISRSNKGMVVVLNERIDELPSDCIGVRIVQSFDRMAFGELVLGSVEAYLDWRTGGAIGKLTGFQTAKRVTISRDGSEHFCCISS